jgi:hypothetical protein
MSVEAGQAIGPAPQPTKIILRDVSYGKYSRYHATREIVRNDTEKEENRFRYQSPAEGLRGEYRMRLMQSRPCDPRECRSDRSARRKWLVSSETARRPAAEW